MFRKVTGFFFFSLYIRGDGEGWKVLQRSSSVVQLMMCVCCIEGFCSGTEG